MPISITSSKRWVVGRLDMQATRVPHLNAVRQGGGVQVRQLEEVVLKGGIYALQGRVECQPRRLVPAVRPEEALQDTRITA